MFTKNTTKNLFTLVLIALLSIIQHHSVDSKSIFEVLQYEGCPDYSSQANLDLNKVNSGFLFVSVAFLFSCLTIKGSFLYEL